LDLPVNCELGSLEFIKKQKKNEISFLKNLENKENKSFEVKRPLLRYNNFGFFVSRISLIIKFKENL